MMIIADIEKHNLKRGKIMFSIMMIANIEKHNINER